VSRGRPSLLAIGIGLGAAGAAGAIGAAGLVADRIRRREDAALPEYASLLEPPSLEQVVIANDGVALYAAVNEPEAGSATSTEAGLPKPTVVLAHGFCLTSECWVLQRRALSRAGYRVVFWDQRGHGRSEKGPESGYAIGQLGEDLNAVLEALVPEGDLVLVGHSMGGMTIMAMSDAHPDVITERTIGFGCVATSAGGLPLANGGLAASVGKALLLRLGPHLAGPLTKRPQVLESLRRANRDLEEFLVERYSFASPVPRSVVRLATRMIMSTDVAVVSDFVPTFDAYDKRSALAHFTGVETLVFNGLQDALTPPVHSEQIVEALPGAEHVLVRDAGHVIMLEHPDLLNQHLLAMIARGEADRAAHVAASSAPRVPHLITPVGKLQIVRERLRERRHHREHVP
jgi:pimeloyl-ACP methyl ester carboxylesterase